MSSRLLPAHNEVREGIGDVRNKCLGLALILMLSGLSLSPGMAQEMRAIEITTYSPGDYTEMLDGSYKKKSAKIIGKLYLPPNVTGAVPAVVVMHGSGGVNQEIDGTVAEAIRKIGMAAFVLDSFTERGLSSTGVDQGKLSMAASVLDSFEALQTLRQQPEIVSSRIGLIGFSRGGVAAMFSGQEPLRRAILGEADGYRASIAVYPGCSTQWEQVHPAKSPMLFMVGEKDDLTPATKCLRYVERINQAGGTAKVVVYPNVSHQFFLASQTRNDMAQNYSDCDMTIKSTGEMYYPKLSLGVGNDWPGFVRKVFADCGKRGFNNGGTLEVRDRAIADITTFFRDNLRQ